MSPKMADNKLVYKFTVSNILKSPQHNHTLPHPTFPSTPRSSPFFTVRLISSSVGSTASLDQTKSAFLIDSTYRNASQSYPGFMTSGSYLVAGLQVRLHGHVPSIQLQFIRVQEVIQASHRNDSFYDVRRDLTELHRFVLALIDNECVTTYHSQWELQKHEERYRRENDIRSNGSGRCTRRNRKGTEGH